MEISLRGLGDRGSPGDEHDEGASSKGECGGEPREREGIQDFLVIYVEHNIQTPPRREVDAHLQLLLIELDADRLGLSGFVGVASSPTVGGVADGGYVEWPVGKYIVCLASLELEERFLEGNLGRRRSNWCIVFQE